VVTIRAWVDAHREASDSGKLFRGFSFSELNHRGTFHFRFNRSAKAGVLEPFTRNPAAVGRKPGFHQPGLLADCGSRSEAEAADANVSLVRGLCR
jgi:hypothetical protein